MEQAGDGAASQFYQTKNPWENWSFIIEIALKDAHFYSPYDVLLSYGVFFLL